MLAIAAAACGRWWHWQSHDWHRNCRPHSSSTTAHADSSAITTDTSCMMTMSGSSAVSVLQMASRSSVRLLLELVSFGYRLRFGRRRRFTESTPKRERSLLLDGRSTVAASTRTPPAAAQQSALVALHLADDAHNLSRVKLAGRCISCYTFRFKFVP